MRTWGLEDLRTWGKTAETGTETKDTAGGPDLSCGLGWAGLALVAWFLFAGRVEKMEKEREIRWKRRERGEGKGRGEKKGRGIEL